MITIVYSISPDDAYSEMKWLKLQKITASYEIEYDWDKTKTVARFAMIVGPEAAMAIKLRRNLDIQQKYKPR